MARYLLLLAPLALALPALQPSRLLLPPSLPPTLLLTSACTLEAASEGVLVEERVEQCMQCLPYLASLWLGEEEVKAGSLGVARKCMRTFLPGLQTSCREELQGVLGDRQQGRALVSCFRRNVDLAKSSLSRRRRSPTFPTGGFTLPALGGLGLAGLSAGLNTFTLNAFTAIGLASLVTG